MKKRYVKVIDYATVPSDDFAAFLAFVDEHRKAVPADYTDTAKFELSGDGDYSSMIYMSLSYERVPTAEEIAQDEARAAKERQRRAERQLIANRQKAEKLATLEAREREQLAALKAKYE